MPQQLRVIAMTALLAASLTAEEDTSAVSAGNSATAQVQSEAGAQASDEPSTGMSVPAKINGKYFSLVGSGGSRSKADLITGAIRFTSSFDDNALNRSLDRVADMQYTISPSLAIEHLRPHTSWKIDYSGGLARNLRLGALDVVTHDLKSEWMHSLARHLQLGLRQSYRLSSNSFTAPGQSEFTHEIGDSGPSVAAVMPAATRTRVEVAGALSWQMSRAAMLTVSGGTSRLRFSGTQDGLLVPTDIFDLRVRYARQLTRRNLAGMTVQVQNLSFPAERGYTSLERFQYFHVVEISNRFAASFYAGPQHAHTSDNRQGAGISSDRWFPTGGLALTWRPWRTHQSVDHSIDTTNGQMGKTDRLSLRATFDDSVGDGDGLTTAARTRSGKLELQSRVARNWQVGFSSGLAENRALGPRSTGLNRFRTFSQTVWVEHRIRPNLEFSADYQFAHQLQQGAAPDSGAIDRNHFQVGLSYEFVRPWGR